MRHVPVRIRERHKIMALMLVGLAVSVWFVGSMEDRIWQQTIEQGQQGLRNLQEQSSMAEEKRAGGWIRSILLWRGALPVVWILTSFVRWGTICLYLSWIFFGFSAGVLWWLLLGAVGWRGPFAMWALMFPQYLCYLPALLLWYIGCLRWHQFRKKHLVLWKNMGKIPEGRLFLLRLLLGGALYLAGIWVEIRVNPCIYEGFFTIS